MGFFDIKALLPIVRPHLPKVEKAAAEALKSVELLSENGEKYAAFVIVPSLEGAKIMVCAFNEQDQVVRTKNSASVTEFLQSLINQSR